MPPSFSEPKISNQFAIYLASKWYGDLRHSYQITKHRAWNTWRNKFGSLTEAHTRWYCGNLKEAFERYSWTVDQDAQPIDDIRFQLVKSINSKSIDNVRGACEEVFKWGGVAKNSDDRSRKWIQESGKNLPELISSAVVLLKEDNGDLADFDGKKLLMNSAMTKIYWAADPERKLIIYDGRVGAALCLLAREFLNTKRCNTVPAELEFRWGRSRDRYVRGQRDRRDPSEGSFKFGDLFAASDSQHAHLMRNSSVLLREVATELKGDGNLVDINDLEKALFMIGYDVTPRLCK